MTDITTEAGQPITTEAGQPLVIEENVTTFGIAFALKTDVVTAFVRRTTVEASFGTVLNCDVGFLEIKRVSLIMG